MEMAMKKLMLLALSMTVSTMVFAHGGYYQQRQGGDFQQDMNVTHDIMHNTSIKEIIIDKGLAFEVTGDSESIRASIKKRFVDEQSRLKAFFEGVDVSVESVESGARITFTSEDESTRNRLKESSKDLIYRYVHEESRGFRGARGYHCSGYGNSPGWRDGHHRGPGMMGGPGYHHRW
jgi:hypothetical protein